MPTGPKTLPKVLAILLAAAVMLAAPAARALLAAAGTGQHSAGCHESGGQIPAPGPVSFQCCQAGHHAALVQEQSNSRPAVLYIAPAVVSQEASPRTSVPADTRNPLTMSGDPPGTVPLRI